MLKTNVNKIVIIKLRGKKYNQSTTFTLQQLVALDKSMRHNFKEWQDEEAWDNPWQIWKEKIHAWEIR